MRKYIYVAINCVSPLTLVGSDTALQYQRQTPCFLLAARTDGLGQDRNGRAKVLLAVVVVLVVVVLGTHRPLH